MLVVAHRMVVAVMFTMMTDPVLAAIPLAVVVLAPHINPLHSVAPLVGERELARTATAMGGIRDLILQINRLVAVVETEDAALVMEQATDKLKA